MTIFFNQFHLERILFGVSLLLSASIFDASLLFADIDPFSDAVVEKEKETVPEKNGEMSAQSNRFSRDRKGVDTPLVDETGEVIFKNPAEKSPSEMSEEDFYKTLTPAEKVILTDNPSSGPELTVAAVKISRVGRPEFAKILAEKALNAEGDPDAYARAVEGLGEEKLVTFAMNDFLSDVSEPLISKVMTEAKKSWQNPVRVQEAFTRTASRSPEIRAAALLDLKRGYPVSLDILLSKLNSDDVSDRQQAEAVLSMGGIFAAEAILARIRVCDDDSVIKLAGVLALNRDIPEVTPLLVRYYDPAASPEARSALEKAVLAHLNPLPSREEAAARAFERGMAYYERKVVLPNVVGGEYPVWRAEEGEEPQQVLLSNETALRWLAAQSLYDAWTLNPDSPEIRAYALVANAEEILYSRGIDEPVSTDSFTKLFPNLTPDDYAAALKTALGTKHEKGGIIPALLLGGSHNTAFCFGTNEPSVLVQAASCRDRRLRFAALKAILELSPSEPYPGSSGVTSSLIWFTTSLGKRHAVLAAPDMTTIGLVGNYISDGGITVLPAGEGRDILSKAQNDADVEFVAALSMIERPDLRTVAQALAADFRTADVPMIIASEDDTRTEQALRYGEGEPNVLVSILPFDLDSGKKIVADLYAKTNPEQVPAEVRLAQAKEAVLLLQKLRETGENVYHIEDIDGLAARFLGTPMMLDEGISFAMTVPSKAVQVIISQLIFDHRFDLQVREKYLAGLESHIGKYGLLLRGPDILRLFSGPWPGDSGEIRKTFFRLLSQNTPEGTEIALSIPSPHIQNLLGDLAGDANADREERMNSLELFKRHLVKYGLLLERSDRQRLYDRYNATETESKFDQEMTGAVLDAVEAWQAGDLKNR